MCLEKFRLKFLNLDLLFQLTEPHEIFESAFIQ